MFKIKFPTKRIFRIFPILRINGMALFCNLFMERSSYVDGNTVNYTDQTREKTSVGLCLSGYEEL